MRLRPGLAGVVAGTLATTLVLITGTLPATASPGLQPEATAAVKAQQTATAVAAATKAAQPQPTAPAPTPATPNGSLLTPDKHPWSEDVLSRIKVPAGFWVDVFAQGLGNTRMMAAAPDGTLYVTRREQGDVLALNDTNGDGKADMVKTIASNLKLVNGIALRGNQLYMVTDKLVVVGDLKADHSLGSLRTIINDLPDAGQHPNRTIAFGPDGMLYITVGSTCNACADTNPENATILRAKPDGTERTIFARGLRNTIGFGWQPSTGQLWGMDQGSDWRGDDQPPEELNLLQPGGNYGWPYCYANRQPDVFLQGDPPGTTKEAYCPTTNAPVLTYQAHSAALGMVFYTGAQFPQQYQGDAFVAMRGSWNRNPPSGYKLVRVRFENGWPVAFEDFMTGFLSETGGEYFGRLAGVAQAPYGSLFVADDANGVIYRISWTGQR